MKVSPLDPSDYSAISMPLAVKCAFLCQRCLASLLSKGGHEIFNVRNDFSACVTQEGETDESEQVSTRRNRETALHPLGSRTLDTDFTVQRVSRLAMNSHGTLLAKWFSLAKRPPKMSCFCPHPWRTYIYLFLILRKCSHN